MLFYVPFTVIPTLLLNPSVNCIQICFQQKNILQLLNSILFKISFKMNEVQIEQKQKYLREHIPNEKYQDFGQFCQSYAGNVDIDSWSFVYVKELVDNFKKELAEEEKQKEEASKKNQHFHIYQTGNANQMEKMAQQLKRQREKQEKNNNQKKKQLNPQPKSKSKSSKSPNKNLTQQKSSGLEVLDSIFQKEEYQTKKYDKSFYESANFWQVPKTESNQQKQISPQTQKPKQQEFKSKVMEPEQFQKIFATGTNIKNQKKYDKNEFQTKKQAVYEEIEVSVIQEKPKSKNIQGVKGKVQKKDQNDSQNFKKKQKSQIKLLSVTELRPKKIPYEGQKLIKKPLNDSIACFRSFQRSALASRDLKVTIKGHEIVERSFFSSNYVMYHIFLFPNTITCKRNLEDFQKLKKNLESTYPGMKLPYIEKTGWLQSETTPQNIEKQKVYLQYFIDQILANPELKNSRLVEEFLTVKEHKLIKRKFEEYDRIKKISCIQELCLLDGEVKIALDEDQLVYNDKISSLINKFKAFLQEKNKLLEQISNYHIILANQYRQLFDLTEKMSEQIHDFNRKVYIHELYPIEEALSRVKAYSHQAQTFNNAQAQQFQSLLLPLVKYEKQNILNLNQIVDNCSSFTKEYLKRYESQKSNDVFEYLSERLKQYKEKPLEQSKSITVFKYQCGYFNNLVGVESERYFESLAKKFSQHYSQLCFKRLSRLSSSLNINTELIEA